MLNLLNQKVNIIWIVNPFFAYCFSFVIAILLYLSGWCDLYPKLSFSLLLFLTISFVPAIVGGIYLKKKFSLNGNNRIRPFSNNLFFLIIIILGAVDLVFGGKIPLFNNGINYREFGVHIIDPLFNTLCIFLSVSFIHSYLQVKEKRLLLYVAIILLFQLLLYRRATIVWIILSTVYLAILYKKEFQLYKLLAAAFLIMAGGYIFGLFGNYRSNLDKSYVVNNLGASQKYINSGISHNYYMAYLYISSPLANLQENIDKRSGFFNKGDIKSFFFYSIAPVSLTLRLEKRLKLTEPACYLITPYLIAGTFFMISFYTLGWAGMFIMLIFLFTFILAAWYLVTRWNAFDTVALSLLTAMASLLIFTNFLIRLDVILLLFIYPLMFHFLQRGKFRYLTSDVRDK